MTGPPLCFCMFVALSSKSCMVASRLSYSTYLSTSKLTWFLCLALVREPTFIHSLPQLLAFLAHQPVLALFSLSLCSLCPSFVLILAFVSLHVLSSSIPILPSVVVLLIAVSVLPLASSAFLSSSTLMYVSSASFCLCFQSYLHEDWIHSRSVSFFSLYYVSNFLFPWSCTRFFPSTIVVGLSTMLVLKPFL